MRCLMAKKPVVSMALAFHGTAHRRATTAVAATTTTAVTT